MIGVAPTVASREVQALLWPRVHGDYAGRTLGPCAYTAGVKARAWKEIIDQWKWSNSEVDPISRHGRSQTTAARSYVSRRSWMSSLKQFDRKPSKHFHGDCDQATYQANAVGAAHRPEGGELGQVAARPGPTCAELQPGLQGRLQEALVPNSAVAERIVATRISKQATGAASGMAVSARMVAPPEEI